MIEYLKKKNLFVPPGLTNAVNLFLAHLEMAKGKPVMIVGETGVGKTMFLEIAKFYYSKKNQGAQVDRIVEANCAHFGREGSDSNIARSEIFGCSKEIALSLRMPPKRGLLRLANNKLLILEEIGELAKDVQAMLLTFIETNTFRELGGTDSIKSKVEIVSATNNLGELREDFKHRFLRFHVPSIHARREDILYYLLYKFPAALDKLYHWEMLCLLSYNWPGNVREIGYVGFLLDREIKLSGKENKSLVNHDLLSTFHDSLLFKALSSETCDTKLDMERLVSFELDFITLGDKKLHEIFKKSGLLELTLRFFTPNFKPKKFGNDDNGKPLESSEQRICKIERINAEFSNFCDFFIVSKSTSEDILDTLCNKRRFENSSFLEFMKTKTCSKYRNDFVITAKDYTNHASIKIMSYLDFISDLNKKTIIGDELQMRKNIWCMTEDQLLTAYFKGMLLLSGLNVRITAKKLQISERTLRNRMEGLGIELDDLKIILESIPDLAVGQSD